MSPVNVINYLKEGCFRSSIKSVHIIKSRTTCQQCGMLIYNKKIIWTRAYIWEVGSGLHNNNHRDICLWWRGINVRRRLGAVYNIPILRLSVQFWGKMLCLLLLCCCWKIFIVTNVNLHIIKTSANILLTVGRLSFYQ